MRTLFRLQRWLGQEIHEGLHDVLMIVDDVRVNHGTGLGVLHLAEGQLLLAAIQPALVVLAVLGSLVVVQVLVGIVDLVMGLGVADGHLGR